MNKYSYITLLSDDGYIYGVILLYESLKRVQSQYPLKVLVTNNVSQPILNILEQLQLEYEIIQPIQFDHILEYNKKANPVMANIWALCLSKLNIFKMYEKDKWIFLDADIMVMKNIDHLFQYPHLTSALDGEYFNLWPGWDHFNSGILVIEPNQNEYDKLIDFINNEALNEKWRPNECIADQEILNHYYKNWIYKPELHLNKYYDIFAPYIQENQIQDIDDNCYFIHFVGRKPWRAFSKTEDQTYTEKYYLLARKLIENVIITLDWNKVRNKIKIAIYGICKNEIENVEKYIECFHNADYVCLLDTGSTDGTWEYLQEAQKNYSNLIIDQQIINPWRYDTARNLSLKLVPKDTTVYFMMDLDEIIKEKNWPNLIRAVWDPLFSRGSYQYHRLVDKETDKPIFTFTEQRIHNSSWHYYGIVHEQLIDYGGKREFFSDECIMVPIAVWHYPRDIKKSYTQLCQRGVAEEPDNWLMHLQLALEYEIDQQYENAIEEYKTIIIEQNNLAAPEIGRCYTGLGKILNLIGKTDEGLRVLQKGQTLIPEYGDNYFMAAEIYFIKNEYQKAYELCNEGLQKKNRDYWCTIISANNNFPYLIMGLSQFYLGNPVLALGYLSIAREINNNKNTNEAYMLVLNNILKR